jgi:hypothetical protein
VQDFYGLGFGGKQYSIEMRFATVEELADFERKSGILWSHGAAIGKRGQ